MADQSSTDRVGVATATSYEDVADEIVRRILALIPTHPEILDMQDVWKLFKVDGFKCDDLQPSMYQAMWALSRAKQIASTGGVK